MEWKGKEGKEGWSVRKERKGKVRMNMKETSKKKKLEGK